MEPVCLVVLCHACSGSLRCHAMPYPPTMFAPTMPFLLAWSPFFVFLPSTYWCQTFHFNVGTTCSVLYHMSSWKRSRWGIPCGGVSLTLVGTICDNAILVENSLKSKGGGGRVYYTRALTKVFKCLKDR